MATSNPPPAFGRRSTEPAQPVIPPFAHLGQIYADLVLTIPEEVLRGIGQQIAQTVADAYRQGMHAGVNAAMADFDAPAPPAGS